MCNIFLFVFGFLITSQHNHSGKVHTLTSKHYPKKIIFCNWACFDYIRYLVFVTGVVVYVIHPINNIAHTIKFVCQKLYGKVTMLRAVGTNIVGPDIYTTKTYVIVSIPCNNLHDAYKSIPFLKYNVMRKFQTYNNKAKGN